MLKFKREGLLRQFRPESPKVRPRGAAKAAGFKRRGPIFAPELATTGLTPCTSPMTSAYDPIPRPSPTPALSDSPVPSEPPPLITLKGLPDWRTVIPLSCQLSSRWRHSEESSPAGAVAPWASSSAPGPTSPPSPSIRGDEQVDLASHIRVKQVLFLRERREER